MCLQTFAEPSACPLSRMKQELARELWKSASGLFLTAATAIDANRFLPMDGYALRPVMVGTVRLVRCEGEKAVMAESVRAGSVRARRGIFIALAFIIWWDAGALPVVSYNA